MKMKNGVVLVMAVLMMLMGALSAQAALRSRIVVLPFYVEQGEDAEQGSAALHYRRMSGFIENRLVDAGFEVVDPFAGDASEMEINRVMEKAKEDSMLTARNMCSRYGVDAAYIVWLKVKSQLTEDGYWKSSATVDGKGYDSAGRSLGANLYKTFRVTRRDYDEAVGMAEKEVGDQVGRVLTQWSARQGGGAAPAAKGKIAQTLSAQSQYLKVRLDQANEYEWVEIFGKVLNTVRGVKEAKRYSQRIVYNNPQACVTEWNVEIDPNQTDPFRLQANMMKMVKDIMNAGGQIQLNGVPYRYTPDEVKMMSGFVPGEATANSLQFVVDRERARDKQFSGSSSGSVKVIE